MRKLFFFIPAIFFFLTYPFLAKYSEGNILVVWHYLSIVSFFIATISLLCFLTSYFFIAVHHLAHLLLKERIHVEELAKIDSIISEQKILINKINTINSPIQTKRL